MRGLERVFTFTVAKPSSSDISRASAKSFGANTIRAARLFSIVSAAWMPYTSRSCAGVWMTSTTRTL